MSDTADVNKHHLLDYMLGYKRGTTDFGYQGRSGGHNSGYNHIVRLPLQGGGQKQSTPGKAHISRPTRAVETMLGGVGPAPEEGSIAFGIDELIFGPMDVAVTKTMCLLNEQQNMDEVKCFSAQHTIKSQRAIHQ